MGGGSSSRAPSVPTVGQDLESAINVLLRRGPDIAALQAQEVQNTLARLAQFAPQARDLETQQLRADVQRATELGPQIRAAAEGPQAQAIRGELGTQIFDELQAGQDLSPSLRRNVQQAARAAQTARGISFGAQPIAEEALFTGERGLALQQQRQAAAFNFLQNQAATLPDPLSVSAGLSGRVPTGLAGGGLESQLLPGLLQQQGQRSILGAQQAFNSQQLAAQQQQRLGGLVGAGAGALIGAPLFAAGPFGALGGALIGSQVGGGIGSALGSIF